MDENSPFHDFSRLDGWLRAHRDLEAMKQRTMLNLSRGEMARGFARPLLLGACGAGLVILAAAIGAYAIVPTFRPKVVEIPAINIVRHDEEVPRIVRKDEEVPRIVTREVQIEIPRFVPAPAPPAPATSMAPDAPRTPVERRFEDSPEWKSASATMRGRILRVAPPNGFTLATDSGGETSFFPAKLGPDGPELDPTRRDDVTGLIGRLAVCRKDSRLTTWVCVSVDPRTGAETLIPQRPRGTPL